MTTLIVRGDGTALWDDHIFRCAIGRGGLIVAADKQEGDGATPVGVWPMRGLLYRADRMVAPQSLLPMCAIQPNDGWCDAPRDSHYNQPVQHPYPASAEHLWRDDAVYDLIVTLGYNDAPVVTGKGSAIFLHLARPDYTPTEGCVALARADLLVVLATASTTTQIFIA